jgi:hypothetical protein
MGLSFLSPLLLGGAALVAAPILLHLLMRRKPVPHPFPALRFLQERAVRNRRRLRLSHLLLLLLRVAAVLLVALALARPVLRGAGWLPDTEGPVAAAFVIDTAPRMAVRQGNQTRLDRAREMAEVLVEKLPGGSRLAVIDTSGTPAAFAGSLAEARDRMERLDLSAAARSLPEAITQARRLLASADLDRREIYVFTDCSRGAWEGASPADDTGLACSVLYVDVAADSVRNCAIDSLELSGVRLATGTPLVIEAAISASGVDGNRLVDVEVLADDGRYVRRGVKPATVGEDGRAAVTFELAGLEPGTRQGRVLLDGGDDLPADDVRSFTVEVGPPGRVLVAAAKPADRTGRLLVEALAPAPLRLAGTARFAPEVIDYAALDLTAWQGAEGVVLLDPPPLPDAVWVGLADWVAEGHGLVVWLGPAAGGPEAFNTPAAQRLLGGRIVRVWRSPDAGNYLAPTDLAHPLMAAFRRVGDEVPWQDFPVTRHWEFQPAELVDEATDPPPAGVVVAYRNGLPAVTEHRVGQGRAVLVTTPVSQSAGDPEAWNTLATGFEPWPFLILANETLLFAIDHAADRNVVVGRPAVLPLGRRDVPTATVRTPGGDDFPVAIDRDTGRVTVTATLEPGNYTIRAGGAIDGVNDGFSANLDPAATDFRRLSPDELAALLGPDLRLARDAEELVRDVNRERVGTELFGWLILLAAAVMAADWIVANRFYAPRDESATAADVAAEFGDPGSLEAVEPDRDPDGPPPLPARRGVAS